MLAIVKADDGLGGGSTWAWAVPLGALGVYLLCPRPSGSSPGCCLDNSEAALRFYRGVRSPNAVVKSAGSGVSLLGSAHSWLCPPLQLQDSPGCCFLICWREGEEADWSSLEDGYEESGKYFTLRPLPQCLAHIGCFINALAYCFGV